MKTNTEIVRKWRNNHREQYNAYQSKYGREHRDKRNKYKKDYTKKLRQEIIKQLGNKCNICGYSGLALCIDHVNNNAKEDKVYRNGKFYRDGPLYLLKILRKIKNGSRNYQMLCANCNLEKELKRVGGG